MVPAKAVRQDLKTETNTIVYMPLATTENPGVVKIGDGLIIDADGVVSFNQDEITILNIAKNGAIIPPDENKIVDIILDKTDVGLDNVDNTSDLNKPVSVYQQQALDNKLNVYQGNELNGKYLYVNSSGYIDFKDVEKLSAFTNDGIISDAVEWLRFSDAFDVEARGLVSIDGNAGDELIIDLSPAFKNSINNVSYDSNTGVLTFNKADGTELKVDLPLELLIKSGRYDDATGEIVLELANDEEIRIPVAQLINHYYADGTTLELIAVDGRLTFKIKDGAITTEKLANASVTSDKIISISADKVIGKVSAAVRATQDEHGNNISTTYQTISNSYNKIEIGNLLAEKPGFENLPVVIVMGGI